jgi:ABC-type multidrug transport system fused ATPase/permease subunit
MRKKEKISAREFVAVFSKALKTGLSVRTGFSLLVAVCGFPMALMPTAISLTLRRFADEVQDLYGKGAGVSQTAFALFFVLALEYLFQTCFQVLQSYFSQKDALDIKEYIKETVLRCACGVKYKYIDNEDDFLNKMAFAKTDSGYRVANSIGDSIVWFQNLIAFGSMLYILQEVDGWIVGVLLISSVPAIILANLQKDEEYRYKTKWMTEGALVIHQFHDCCAQKSLNEVRFLGLFDFLKGKWRHSADRYRAVKNAMTRKHVVCNLAADFLRSCVFLFVLYLAARKIFLQPEIGIGVFLLVLNTCGSFQKTAAKLFSGAAQFAGDVRYMKDFFDLEKVEKEEYGEECGLANSEIVFDGVSFSYPNSENRVLKEISVRIHPGEKVAIVGENGSGKTTFINLLLGLYAPQEGTIMIGNLPLAEHVRSCRKNMSAIFQNFGKYEATIRQNIVISDLDRPEDDRGLLELMEKAGAGALLENQKNGLDEMVGSLSDQGNNLSGGQWQRLAITRAAYRENAKIMILDEPTAALDPLAEAELYRNFAKIVAGRTTLFVSHRLGVSKIVDRILVFQDGRIAEDGSHEELMRKNGLYAKMYHAQAQWYN